MEAIMQTSEQNEMAVFRYGIISPLLHRNEDDGPLENELIRLSSKTYVKPCGRRAAFSPETLRKWLYRYRHGGLPALADALKSSTGTHPAVPKSLEGRLFELRQEHPRWTVARLLDQLIQEGLWDMRHPARSTLYRFAGTQNLVRDPHLIPHEPARPFEYQAFGQMWTADFLHGPKIRIQGQKRKTYLHAIIDDATRFIVRAGFYTREDTEILMMELMAAIRTHGKPLRFYTDNGACYKSKHLSYVCANLGVQLIHTPPGKPRGRGKIERFFRTVRDRFLDGDTPPARTLDGLNTAFTQWLSSYHTGIHSSLGTSPLQKRLSQQSACRPIPETLDIEPLFRMTRRVKVYMDNTVQLKRQKYEVRDALPGQRLDIWFLPWDLSVIWYGKEMRPAKPVNLILNAQR